MSKLRKTLWVLSCVVLLIPSFFVTAATNSSNPRDEGQLGAVSSKDEVVYATLSASGERQELYVVNILEVEEAGTIIDHGIYTSLRNLTDLSPLVQKGDVVEIEAQEGTFYYQGNMDQTPLPWDISITYLLDGEKIAPEQLAGQSGQVEIHISTSANEQVNKTFFEHYMLQISLSLNTELFQNIEAPDGVLANAGKDKQVTYTVLPNKAEVLVLTADVVDFELGGIDIAAIPFAMSIDAPDLDDMTKDIGTLADAIEDVHYGVGELKTGVIELNNGLHKLRDGSAEYRDGMTAIGQSSQELVHASKSIQQALTTLSEALGNGPEMMDLGDLNDLGAGLSQIADGLNEASLGLEIVGEHYTTAYHALDQVMDEIPEYVISEEQIGQLYASGADQGVLDQLLEAYVAARTAKGTYTAVQQAFDAVEGTLPQISEAISEMVNHVSEIAAGLSNVEGEADLAQSFSQLQDGITQLAMNYEAFHAGLESYTGGVSQLSGSYSDIHNGMGQLAVGTGQLKDGVTQLHDGTAELSTATSDLPEQMKREVDHMIAEYDASDFEPISFVSANNENVESVQFVLRTEKIERQPTNVINQPVEEEKGFWARLRDLF